LLNSNTNTELLLDC